MYASRHLALTSCLVLASTSVSPILRNFFHTFGAQAWFSTTVQATCKYFLPLACATLLNPSGSFSGMPLSSTTSMTTYNSDAILSGPASSASQLASP
ncbi:hypothetical protein EDB83DRAFT_2415272 [Lactarius deliciosus]|nr:hypothetical protein EDB83DRAFT_2415272 [Lactarius deliciosus]